jgi:hypothetical protein
MSDMSLATTRWFLAFAKCANLRCGQPKRSGLSGFGLRKGVDLEIPIGLEVGENLRNRITAIRNGYGGIARFVPGASFYAVSPEFWGHVKATWSSTYTARLLMANEPFIDYRDAHRPHQSHAEHAITLRIR